MPGYELGRPSEDSRRTSKDSYSSWEGFSDEQDETTKSIPASTSKMSTLGTVDSHLDIASDWTDSEDSTEIGKRRNGVAIEYIKGREYEVEIIYQVKPSPDYMHSMLETILHLHVQEPLPGDILAFLTGQDEIETLQAELENHAEKLVKAVPKMKVMPLYGAL